MSLKFRLYYWLLSDSKKGDYEPWKYADFDSEEELQNFLSDMKPLLNKYAAMMGDKLPDHDPTYVVPPKRLLEANK